MVSFDVRRPLRALWPLVFAVVAVAQTASAHSPLDPGTSDPHGRIFAKIAEAQAEGGLRSKELIAPYYGLRSLEHEGLARTVIDEVFSPEMPVLLPTFLPDPLASEGARQRLVELISGGRFRPRMTAGEFDRTSRVVARYLVNE